MDGLNIVFFKPTEAFVCFSAFGSSVVQKVSNKTVPELIFLL